MNDNFRAYLVTSRIGCVSSVLPFVGEVRQERNIPMRDPKHGTRCRGLQEQ